MEINRYIFREYDIRGVYGKDINEDVAYYIGKAFGTKLRRYGKNTTLVGYDNRYSSPNLEKNLVRGILECGVDVVRLGLVTTPIILYPDSCIFFNASIAKSGVPINKTFNIIFSPFLSYNTFCYFSSDGLTISKVPGSIISTKVLPFKWSIS